MAKKDEKMIWRARKRNFIGLPWTFTVYRLDDTRLYIKTGIFNIKEDEIRLYRITDVTFMQSFWQRIFRMATVHCDSADATMKNFDIKNIKEGRDVKNMLSEMVDAARKANRVYMHENVSGTPHIEGDAFSADLPDGAFSDTDLDGVPDAFDTN
ncbi:MAG: PH domain-containing protein [Firmicutes bacterium]|nr:PH domain-containing protein [Bacillota bacterium]MBR2577144.1 PH domain-containing protein [Bacillota bacterium]